MCKVGGWESNRNTSQANGSVIERRTICSDGGGIGGSGARAAGASGGEAFGVKPTPEPEAASIATGGEVATLDGGGADFGGGVGVTDAEDEANEDLGGAASGAGPDPLLKNMSIAPKNFFVLRFALLLAHERRSLVDGNR